MYGDASMIRDSEFVGGRQVVWLKGVPEAVEEFMREMIPRYPELLPQNGALVVAMSTREEPAVPFYTRRVEEGTCGYVALLVTDRWWGTEPDQREFDFVMSMCMERNVQEGLLVPTAGGMRLEIGSHVYLDQDAVDFMNRMAAFLVDSRAAA